MKVITIIKGFLLFQLFWICACSKTNQVGNNNFSSIEITKKEDLNEFIGKKVTITGITVNMKLGAALILENGQIIWMNDMLNWPNDYYTDKKTTTVKVTGFLMQQNDLPVFISNENDSIIHQGIPTSKGADLKEATHRYLLKEYEWDLIK
jgi:hypothetical protein